ncbi:hypothetical protein [Terrihabitans rhizophilus]|uniref:Uncharacterized protein n=1 Tax=Terrihabitans rhizophilus TaxID=3092662 RepID=A0ABU4RRI8_9HYPH|nr:hypothetical protein [Terrihabitans sp. PJ23]MDX6806290.1 hypothetical protein [Terrihabitans sp. PJ23]
MNGLDPETVNALPPELRALLYIAILAITVLGGVKTWGKATKATPETVGKDVMVTAGGFVDMEPVRDLAAQIMGATKVAEMAYREGKSAAGQIECVADELRRLHEELKGVREILARMAEEDRINNQLIQRRREGG